MSQQRSLPAGLILYSLYNYNIAGACAGRLKGVSIGVSAMPSLPLSVEGHAHRLIEEAVDKENLGSMYIWWMAWF